MKKIGANQLTDLLPALDALTFSAEVFRKTGVFVIRQAIKSEHLKIWIQTWNKFYCTELSGGRRVNRFNPVSVDDEYPLILADIHKSEELLDIVEQVFGPDIALYNQRFVIKDSYRKSEVFVHNDSPYHFGWPNKASAFVALSSIDRSNGKMFFYPGTHQFGYLSDAGELDPTILGENWPVISPDLTPGDVVLMDSSLWHGSHPFDDGVNRIFADIIYQPADDPSGISLLRGQWQTEIFMVHDKSKVFKRSRASRIAELQEKLDGFRADNAQVLNCVK